jgi:hypothetical protein
MKREGEIKDRRLEYTGKRSIQREGKNTKRRRECGNMVRDTVVKREKVEMRGHRERGKKREYRGKENEGRSSCGKEEMVRRRCHTGKKRTDEGRGSREKGTFEEEVRHRDMEGSGKTDDPIRKEGIVVEERLQYM